MCACWDRGAGRDRRNLPATRAFRVSSTVHTHMCALTSMAMLHTYVLSHAHHNHGIQTCPHTQYSFGTHAFSLHYLVWIGVNDWALAMSSPFLFSADPTLTLALCEHFLLNSCRFFSGSDNILVYFLSTFQRNTDCN